MAKIHKESSISKLIHWFAKSVDDKNFEKEWFALFSAALIIRIIAYGISIYASQSFFYELIETLLKNQTLSLITSIIGLTFLELADIISIGKFFEKLLKKEWMAAVYILPFAFLLYSGSLLTGSLGLQDKAELITDQSIRIDSIMNVKKDSITDYYRTQTGKIENSIKLIRENPQGWVKGKRSVLTIEQESEISRLNQSIERYNIELKDDLNKIEKETNDLKLDNKQTKHGAGKKYLFAILFLQGLKLISTFFLTFYFIRIRKEKNGITEVDDIKKDLTNVKNELKVEMYKEFVSYVKGLGFQIIETLRTDTHEPIVYTDQLSESADKDGKPTRKPMGFISIKNETKSNDQNIETHRNAQSCPTKSPLKKPTKKPKEKEVDKMGKHEKGYYIKNYPDVVEMLKKLNDWEQKTCPRHISRPIMKKTGWSRTTIRNVYKELRNQ